MYKVFLASLIVFLSSCGTMSEIDIIDDITAPDYVSSSKARKLEIPPDLSEIDNQNNYEIPGEAKSYKSFQDKKNIKPKKLIKVVQDPKGMKIIKSGNLRWLLVEKDPDTLWPHIQDFWEEDVGARVKVANKRTGVIETEWISTEDLSKESDNALDRWLDSMSGFADKRKFRTRLELGSKENTTEIFLSHRSSFIGSQQHEDILKNRGVNIYSEESLTIRDYIPDDSEENKSDISNDTKVKDYEINSEILRRLMIKLGATDFDAKEKIESPQKIIKARLVSNEKEIFIKMDDPYDRSWRRLSLALDIIGFITEDRNRSEGIFFVKYKDIELPSEISVRKDRESGILNSLLFWRDDEVKESIDDKKNEDSNRDNTKKAKKDESSNNINTKSKSEIWKDRFENFKLWGSDEEEKPNDEFRYRVRIKSIGDYSKVYLDLPNGAVNNSREGQAVLKIIYEQLK